MARAAAIFAAAAVIGSADAGFVDFDELAFAGVMTSIDANHYASLGMFFSADPHIVSLSIGSPGSVGAYVTGGGTLDNALALSTSIDQTHIDISFFMPGTGEAAMTDSFSALFFDSNVGTELGSIEAYGLNGEFLGSVSAIAPPEMVQTLFLNVVGIHRIRLGTDLDGNIIDNISFGPLYVIPGPGAFALLGLGGFAGGRRRRR